MTYPNFRYFDEYVKNDTYCVKEGSIIRLNPFIYRKINKYKIIPDKYTDNLSIYRKNQNTFPKSLKLQKLELPSTSKNANYNNNSRTQYGISLSNINDTNENKYKNITVLKKYDCKNTNITLGNEKIKNDMFLCTCKEKIFVINEIVNENFILYSKTKIPRVPKNSRPRNDTDSYCILQNEKNDNINKNELWMTEKYKVFGNVFTLNIYNLDRYINDKIEKTEYSKYNMDTLYPCFGSFEYNFCTGRKSHRKYILISKEQITPFDKAVGKSLRFRASTNTCIFEFYVNGYICCWEFSTEKNDIAKTYNGSLFEYVWKKNFKHE